MKLAVQRLTVALVAASVVSDAFFLPALPPWAGAAVPLLIGGKLFLVPQMLLLKGGIGMAGLKIAGAQYLKSKVLIPASLSGAQAGYKATSAFLSAPKNIAASTSASLSGLASRLPSMPPMPRFEVQEAPPVKMLPEFEHTFHVPAVPMPALQWYKKPLTLTLPKMVFQRPPTLQKTITIEKHIHHHDNIVNEPAPVVAEAPAYGASSELPEVGYGAAPVSEVSPISYADPSSPEVVASEEPVPVPEAGPGYTNEFPQVNESFQ